MAQLFDRAFRLTVAKPDGFFLQRGTNALVIERLRADFQAEKHLGKEPNTCRISVTNLAETTRVALQGKPLYVRLEAGYEGQVQRLFEGDLRWSQSVREGADWVTSLELGDGERAYRHARVPPRSYRAGVDVRTALTETARAMGLTLPAEAAGLRELSKQFTGGLTLSGVAADEMQRLLAPFGLVWSVQDGRLQILSASGTRADEALVISQDTGLIGSPEYGAPANAKDKPVLSLRTLLYPSVTPGGKILVQARAVRGVFKVQRVTHVGDTHGGAWDTEIEATPV